MRIVFMATGDIALPTFAAIPTEQIVALVTQPDKPVGRKQILTPPTVKTVAQERGIPVMQPTSARGENFLTDLASLQPDIIVVMAYGQILNQKLLDIPALACINVHASLLPKFRGAACIQAAIDAGDASTGVTIMHVVKKLDAGDIILKHETPIGAQETGGELHDRLADLAPAALKQALTQLTDGTATRTPQDPEQVSYISKLMRDDGEIDWSQPAEALERRIRAYHPWPGTSTSYTDKKGRARRLKIFPPTNIVSSKGEAGTASLVEGKLTIHCGEGALEIKNLQPDGSRRMTAAEFLLSDPLENNQQLGA